MPEVFIDRDVPYREFRRDLKEITARTRNWMRSFVVGGTFEFHYRRSSGGHVHWAILAPDLTEYQTFQLRAHLGDDWHRTFLDLKRVAVGNTQINRAWDQRWVHGKMIRSGPWIRWFRVSTLGLPSGVRPRKGSRSNAPKA